MNFNFERFGGTTWLWPHSNETFVPAPELLIFIYIRRSLFLTLRTGVGQVS
jgi:hypothetical protein